jgi:FMN phosphatase YigB (HAD superfamily)
MGVRMMRLSPLGKTWIFDLDGVLAPHNGHLTGADRLLPGVAEFFAKIAPGDMTVLVSSRDVSMRETSLAFLAAAGIRIDHAIFGVPHGERILFNDRKPSGLATAHAVNLNRDEGLGSVGFVNDPGL